MTTATSGPVTLVVDPRTDPRWSRLARGPVGSLFTSPPWITALSDEYGFHPEARVLVDAEGEPSAGFTWMRVTDLRGDRISSLPFSERAEPFAPDAATWRRLATDALDTALSVTLRCFDDHPAVTAPELTRVGEAAWHSTSLAPTLDDIMAGFTPEARRAVRAAGRRGVRVVVRADLDAVAAFHRLHVGLRKGKYGLLAQPLSFFERIWESFSPSDGIVTLLAEADGEAVAGAVYLVWNDALYYKFGASRPDHLRLLPNDAIAWTAMTWAKDRGLTRLDWGLSDLDQPGLLAFKRKWGVEERTIVTLRRPGPPPSTADREFGALLGELTQVFTDGAVPDEVTARGGASLYRYFC